VSQTKSKVYKALKKDNQLYQKWIQEFYDKHLNFIIKF